MKTIYTSERKAWREWLAEHFETESEIWFVFPMKESGDKALSYNDAVEEALCFGWIDSTIKHIDPTHRAQRFTPRKKGSPYSRPNIERLIWLDEQGLLHPKEDSRSTDMVMLQLKCKRERPKQLDTSSTNLSERRWISGKRKKRTAITTQKRKMESKNSIRA